jgi:hypothetical protein
MTNYDFLGVMRIIENHCLLDNCYLVINNGTYQNMLFFRAVSGLYADSERISTLYENDIFHQCGKSNQSTDRKMDITNLDPKLHEAINISICNVFRIRQQKQS